MQRLERLLLYVLMILLVLAFGFDWPREEDRADSQEEPDGSSGTYIPTDAAGTPAKVTADPTDVAALLVDHDESVSEKLAGITESVQALAPGGCGPASEACPPHRVLTIASNFTLLYKNAHLDTDRRLTERSAGVGLAPRHEQRLEMIERAFTPCQEHGPEKVVFEVTGFSSTGEFYEDTPTGRRRLPNSDALNLKVANLRAQLVAARLQEAGFEAKIPHIWESIDDLRRPYLDDAQPGTDQQALNRSVFIKVLNAGACDLRQVP